MSVRLYDLARELRQDTKRIIDDARREGVELSSTRMWIDNKTAEKIRKKYLGNIKTPNFKILKIAKSAGVTSIQNSSIKKKRNSIPVKKEQAMGKCVYCRIELERKGIKRHEINCSQNLALNVNSFQSSFGNPKISRLSVRNDKKQSKKCRNDGCDNQVRIASDICFDCIRHAK